MLPSRDFILRPENMLCAQPQPVPTAAQVGTSSAEPTQAPAVARPVLTATEFYEMCLEGSSPATGARTPQATFVPLAKDEAPAPGMLLGLDAEFVALSQPDRRLIGCAAAPSCC